MGDQQPLSSKSSPKCRHRLLMSWNMSSYPNSERHFMNVNFSFNDLSCWSLHLMKQFIRLHKCNLVHNISKSNLCKKMWQSVEVVFFTLPHKLAPRYGQAPSMLSVSCSKHGIFWELISIIGIWHNASLILTVHVKTVIYVSDRKSKLAIRISSLNKMPWNAFMLIISGLY